MDGRPRTRSARLAPVWPVGVVVDEGGLGTQPPNRMLDADPDTIWAARPEDEPMIRMFLKPDERTTNDARRVRLRLRTPAAEGPARVRLGALFVDSRPAPVHVVEGVEVETALPAREGWLTWGVDDRIERVELVHDDTLSRWVRR